MNRARNHSGVMDSCDLYRTFNGKRYSSLAVDASKENLAVLRAEGIQCRSVRYPATSSTELFVPDGDGLRALEVLEKRWLEKSKDSRP